MLSRLTVSARKYTSTGADKDTREGMIAGANHLLRSLERAMGMEDATKKGQVQEFFHKKLQRLPGQPMAEWVNVCEKVVLDMTAQGLNVELKSSGWHLFRKEQSDPGATRTCVWGC